MSQTYSTRQWELSGGKVYSSRVSQVTAQPQVRPSVSAVTAMPVAAPTLEAAAARTLVPAVGALPVAAPEQRFTFALSPQGTPAAGKIAPNASGNVSLVGDPGGTWRVTSTITGPARLPDPALVPALWLIHDLTVPADLHPDDLALLPKGRTGQGNQPGTVFTVDGNPPTGGRTVLQPRWGRP
jgi:hypothetical protein